MAKEGVKHLTKRSAALDKATTVLGLVMMITGMAFWYPSITGNAIAQSSKGFVGYGFLLFFIGLLGVFLANRK